MSTPFDSAGTLTVYVDGNLTTSTSAYSIANRNGTGTDGMGYKTLNEAISSVRAGGTIYVRAGTYSELGTAHTCFQISKNMTLQAYNGETVNLTYPVGNPPLTAAGEFGRIMRWTNANVTLDGFTVIGTHDEGDSVSQDDDVSLFIEANSQGTVRNCTFQKFGHACVKFVDAAGAVLIEKNLFQAGGFAGRDHHIYISEGVAAGTTIRHNAFTGAAGYAVHLYSAPINVDVYGNVINANGGTYEPVNGGGILLGGTGHHIYNNTIVSNTGYGGIVFWKVGCNGNVVKNNIIRDNDSDITVDGAGANTVGYNNKATLSGAGYDPGGTDLNVDPQFAGSPLNSWDDYRLTDPGSPMIDAGADVGAGYIAILDPASTTRPSPKNQGANRDIGAFTT